ncbi:MAG: AMP-binding protein [Dehalococcoidia bacterium]|nr:AMP-binding protein [Dehalococcoidia bacterium]
MMTGREELAGEYLAKGYWEGLTVSQALDRAVDAFPERLALVHGDQRITYKAMRLRAERLASGFLGKGILPGDMVTVQMPNLPEFVYVHYALAKIGAITLPAIPLYRRKEMAHILDFSHSVGYVAPSNYGGFDYLKMLDEMRPNLPGLRHVFVVGEPAPPGAHSIRDMLSGDEVDRAVHPYAEADRAVHPYANSADSSLEGPASHDDIACLVITGGTTGHSKGVPRTHDELLCHARSWAKVMGVTPDSNFLVMVPLTHVFGLVEGLYAPLTAGATLILMDRFEAADALRLIQQERVTQTLTVPALIVSLIHYPRLEDFDTSSLKAIITGGGPCPEEVIHQARALLGCDIISQYGMSEGTISTTVLGDPPDVVSVTVGAPHCEGSELKIVDDERRTMAGGEQGELAFRGPTLFKGYFEDPAETSASFDMEGWFYTGDLCFQDEWGNLHIVGRKKDTIKRGGETIMPRELEELLFTHPKIMAAAVVGMPDARLGERVCAYVVPNRDEEITLHEIVRFLKTKGVATFKLPERLELVDRLPITPPSKVQKNILKEDVARKLEAEGKDREVSHPRRMQPRTL